MAKNAYLRPAFHQAPAQGVRRLETDNQDGGARIFDIVLEVVQNPARLAHAAGRDDHGGTRVFVERDALVNLVDIADALLAKHLGVLIEELARFFIETWSQHKAGLSIDDVGRRKIDEQLHIAPLFEEHLVVEKPKRKKPNP